MATAAATEEVGDGDRPAPRFTVVVATHDRAELLPDCLANLDRQEERDFEVVVVDDGSTDDTPAVLGGLDHPWLRSVRRPNGGLAAARNTGIHHARGRFVVVVDDDDRPHPGWLAAFARAVDGQGAVVASCGIRRVTADGTVLGVRLPAAMGPAFEGVDGLFLGGTTCVRRDALLAVGGYREDQPTSHQTELMLRLLPRCTAAGWPVVAVPEPLLDVTSRPPGERPRNDPRRLLVGTLHLVEDLHDQVARDPALLADYAGVAGVAAARAGELATARHWLAVALRSRPTPRRAGRLALAWVGPAARRAWPS